MMTINGNVYRELRCKSCRKLICYEYVFAGRLAYHCPRCGELNEIEFKKMKTTEVENVVNKEFTVNMEGGEK
jgi:phage FluMu protein Com